jgi:hypothetical protein
MIHRSKVDSRFVIPSTRFDNEKYIQKRVAAVPAAVKGCLRSLLRYLYESNDPTNSPKARYSPARRYLEAAELVLANWLRTRTNGHHRKAYGRQSLLCARSQRYRCQTCRFPDVRALHLDHVEGKIAGASFACLCANCHNIKSRKYDWTGKKRTVGTPLRRQKQSSVL